MKFLAKDRIKSNKNLFKTWLIYAVFYFFIILGVNILADKITANYENSQFGWLTCNFIIPLVTVTIIDLISAPLLTGYLRFILNAVTNKNTSISDIIIFYKTPNLYFKSVVINLCIDLVRELYTCIFNYLRNAYLVFTLSSLSPLIILAIACILLSILLFVSNYILALNPKESIFYIIKKSILIMFKNILGYIKLQLSFLGWWLLTLLIYISVSMIIPNQSSVLIKLISDISGVFMFGVGFYFYPYYNTSLAIYAKQLLESE
jgi:hypothetical protein